MEILYTLTSDKNIPSILCRGDYSTPIWIQQKWKDGQYSEFIRKNGCGHCCTAMALNLFGIKINPHEEFTLCRKMWGNPRYEEPICEDNFISTAGIVKVIKSFGINAEAFGVPVGKYAEAAGHIEDSLKSGKLVIFWSSPSEKLIHNPFSTGEHYVLAVGFNKDGKIIIANSTENSDAENGIQYTNTKTIALSLRDGCDPQDFTWGRYDLVHSGGYVVIG